MLFWPDQLVWLGIAPQIVAILLPVGLAIWSRRLTVVLGALLFAIASVCILLAPAKAVEIIACSFYLASFMVAIYGIVAHRKSSALRTEVDQLREQVNGLSIAAGRRFVKELNEDRKRMIDGKPARAA